MKPFLCTTIANFIILPDLNRSLPYLFPAGYLLYVPNQYTQFVSYHRYIPNVFFLSVFCLLNPWFQFVSHLIPLCDLPYPFCICFLAVSSVTCFSCWFHPVSFRFLTVSFVHVCVIPSIGAITLLARTVTANRKVYFPSVKLFQPIEKCSFIRETY